MSKYLALILLLFAAGCKTSSGLRVADISSLNGEWNLPCVSSFVAPEVLECPEVRGYERFEVDPATGMGSVRSGSGVSKAEMKIRVYEEKRKLFIHYFLPGNEEAEGEIIKLDREELVVRFPEQQYYLTRKRRE